LVVVDNDLIAANPATARVELAGQTQGIHRILLANVSSAMEEEETNLEVFHNVFLKPIKASQLFDCVAEAVEGRIATAVRRRTRHASGTLPVADGIANLRILLAEDHLTNRRLCELVLESFGQRADIATNGQEALRQASQQDYEVILMDCHMPEMDGYDATRAIRQLKTDGRRPYIVALTANALAGERERCLAAGMDDYISKPFTARQLEQVLARSVKRRDEADESNPQITAVAESVLFDAGRLDQLCKDLDDEGVCAIVTDFLAEFPGQVLQLQEFAKAGQWEEVARLAHSMQGITGSLGLGVIPARLRQLEDGARQGLEETIRLTLPTLVEAATKSESALKSWLAAHRH